MTTIVTNVVARSCCRMLDPTGIMAVVNSFIAFFNAIQSAIEYLRDILEIVNRYVTTLAADRGRQHRPGRADARAGPRRRDPDRDRLPRQPGRPRQRPGEDRRDHRRPARRSSTEALDWLIEQAAPPRPGGARRAPASGAAAARRTEDAGRAATATTCTLGEEALHATRHVAAARCASRAAGQHALRVSAIDSTARDELRRPFRLAGQPLAGHAAPTQVDRPRRVALTLETTPRRAATRSAPASERARARRASARLACGAASRSWRESLRRVGSAASAFGAGRVAAGLTTRARARPARPRPQGHAAGRRSCRGPVDRSHFGSRSGPCVTYAGVLRPQDYGGS